MHNGGTNVRLNVHLGLSGLENSKLIVANVPTPYKIYATHTRIDIYIKYIYTQMLDMHYAEQVSREWSLTNTIIFDDGYDHSVETGGSHPPTTMNKKGKGKGNGKSAGATDSDPPRIVLAVGITHPQIVADWRKAYLLRWIVVGYLSLSLSLSLSVSLSLSRSVTVCLCLCQSSYTITKMDGSNETCASLHR